MTAAAKNEAKSNKYKILIVDDHPIVRQGLVELGNQEPDLDICEGPDNVADALKQIKAMQPDLVIVDISLRNSNGMELLSQIKAHDGRIKTLVWSMFDENAFAERALRAGAMGYVMKQEPIKKLIEAIRRVLQGDMYLSTPIVNRILQAFGDGQPLRQDPVAALSDREREVFLLIGQGVAARQIAKQLGVSTKTIEAHREKIKTKLSLKTAAELNRRAVQWVLENH